MVASLREAPLLLATPAAPTLAKYMVASLREAPLLLATPAAPTLAKFMVAFSWSPRFEKR